MSWDTFLDWRWSRYISLNWSSGNSTLLNHSRRWSRSLTISAPGLNSLSSCREELLVVVGWQRGGQLGHKRVRVVRRFASADCIESCGCGLHQKALLPSIKDTGGEQDLVAVRLGVVFVAHVVHEPGPVASGHRDEASAQKTRHFARRGLARVGKYFLCHFTSYHLSGLIDTDNMVEINNCPVAGTK